MKVRSSRIEGAFRPFGVRIIFESYGEVSSWREFLLAPNPNVVGVQEVMEQMAEQMDFLNDEGQGL